MCHENHRRRWPVLCGSALPLVFVASAVLAQPLTITVHPDSAGIVAITDVSGFGSFVNPIVIEQAWSGSDLEATISINGALDQFQMGLNPAGGPFDWGIFVEARIANQSGACWTLFDNELQEIIGVPSADGDGLSFAEGWAAVRPGGGLAWFGSPELPEITEETENRDFVSFSGGAVDPGEVLIMRYVITDQSPIDELYLRQRPNFGSIDTIDATWEAPCLTPGGGSANVCICNAFSEGAVYDWTVSALPGMPGTACNVDGPDDITPDSGSIFVPAGQCEQFGFTFTCPGGLAAGDHGCYSVVAQRRDSDCELRTIGSTLVIDHWFAEPGQLVYGIPFGAAADVCFEITNIMEDEVDGVLDFEFVGVKSDMENPFQDIISLNGLPPGTSVAGSVTLSHGESEEVCVSVSYEEDDPYTFYAILFEYDVDEDPGTPIEAAASAAIVSVPPGPCPGDTNGDGQVNVNDLVNVIGSWGTDGQGPGIDADLDDDGDVGVPDIISVITNWGACP